MITVRAAAALEPFWPGRRAWVTDEWCRRSATAPVPTAVVPTGVL